MLDLMLTSLTPGDTMLLAGLLSFLFIGQLVIAKDFRDRDKYQNELRAKHGLPPI